VDSLTGALAGSWYDAHVPVTFQEYAAFADVTFHLTERIDVQVGGRESRNRQTFASTIVGPYVPRFFGVPSPLVTPERESKDNAFTYLVTPQMRISPDLMVYARLASGYRPGGPNTFTAALSVPASYGPDQTLNYELGVKGNVLDRALTIDASLYYIEWKDIQISVTDPVSRAAYFTNGSRARSEGIELSAESRPLTGLTIAAWAAWNDAELTEDFPATRTAYGVAGDRLPYSSRFSGNLSVDQDFPLARGLVGFAGASVSYIGEREGIFRSSPQRQLFPSYAQTDLRFGAKYDAWTVNAFITNVADKRGVLRGGLDSFRPTYFTYIQPRTVGLSLSRTFQPQ
jgi:outer membrane receptor protein involved in Fe transport